jgi:quercetin dioxygenase-like cupin family protein
MTTIALTLLSACTTMAQEPASELAAPGAKTEVLVQSSHSWDGGDFAYPEGDAQLTVAKIIIPAGVALPMHCHPVPLGGVLTRGILEVTKENGERFLLNGGEGLIEVSNQWHYGQAVEEVEIVVVYAGAKDIPVTVLKDGGSKYVKDCH